MQHKRKAKSTFPISMFYNNQHLFGSARFHFVSIHLQNCFTISQPCFSTDYAAFSEEISDIYSDNFRNTYTHEWDEYVIWFTLSEVIWAISSLNVKKDSGPMNISAEFVKKNIDTLAPILLNIFNTVMATGVIPSVWKKSFIAPIPKKGAINDVSNYHGIAMQSTIPKIFNKLITSTS